MGLECVEGTAEVYEHTLANCFESKDGVTSHKIVILFMFFCTVLFSSVSSHLVALQLYSSFFWLISCFSSGVTQGLLLGNSLFGNDYALTECYVPRDRKRRVINVFGPVGHYIPIRAL